MDIKELIETRKRCNCEYKYMFVVDEDSILIQSLLIPKTCCPLDRICKKIECECCKKKDKSQKTMKTIRHIKKDTTPKLLIEIQRKIGEEVVCDYSPLWLKENRHRHKIKYFIKNLKIAIEIDGLDHFMSITDWKNDPEKKIINDCMKMQRCKDRGIKTIRIYYMFLATKEELCIEEVIKAIINISSNESFIIFIDGDNKEIYDKHKKYFYE